MCRVINITKNCVMYVCIYIGIIIDVLVKGAKKHICKTPPDATTNKYLALLYIYIFFFTLVKVKQHYFGQCKFSMKCKDFKVKS